MKASSAEGLGTVVPRSVARLQGVNGGDPETLPAAGRVVVPVGVHILGSEPVSQVMCPGGGKAAGGAELRLVGLKVVRSPCGTHGPRVTAVPS